MIIYLIITNYYRGKSQLAQNNNKQKVLKICKLVFLLYLTLCVIVNILIEDDFWAVIGTTLTVVFAELFYYLYFTANTIFKQWKLIIFNVLFITFFILGLYTPVISAIMLLILLLWPAYYEHKKYLSNPSVQLVNSASENYKKNIDFLTAILAIVIVVYLIVS